MAAELVFSKTDDTPWGFRLTGGSDFDFPLTVIKVTENSIAENAGMQVGDVIVKINDEATAGLTHTQAHDVILAAGYDFVLAVRRGDLSNLPQKALMDEEAAAESTDDGTVVPVPDDSGVETKPERRDSDLNITDEEIANIIGETIQATEETTHIKSEVLQVITSEVNKSQQKKWSTFLQKPKNPKPKPKPVETEAPKAPPYRVVIVKQPKKSLETSEPITNDVTSNTETLPNESPLTQLPADEPEIAEPEDIADATEEKQEQEPDKPEDFGENQQEEPIDEQQNKDEDNVSVEVECSASESRRMSEAQSIPEISLSLEEQLLQVQQQLLALSQLPSSIQSTLNAVTQQLELIVSSTRHEEEHYYEATVQEGGYQTISAEVLEEKALSTLAEEEEFYEREEINAEEILRYESEEVNIETNKSLEEGAEVEQNIEQGPTEEELEAQREEQEKMEKREKDMFDEYHFDQRASHPLTPLQRPIILPGGRRWSQPDDAVSKIRRPSMTDEKIANTINTYSEVIVGRTVGINFLKYQPPPKNLDHLQRSDVYKMVHNMEPQPRGIVARENKVLAEQDYYSEEQETNSQLPPQMER